jgi:Tfp pilus assembly protein PilN
MLSLSIEAARCALDLKPSRKRRTVVAVSANLNLASQPFRNRAFPWTVTAIIAIVSFFALVLIISKARETNRQTGTVASDVNNLRMQANALKVRADEVKAALTPEQRQLRDAAELLVERKRFSWSRLFADLEASLPGNVRVTRISVRDVASQGGRTSAELELSVVSKNPNEVTEMIGNMSRTGIFDANLLAQNLQRGRNETGTESTLRVIYRPSAGAPTTAPQGSSNIAATRAATAARSVEAQ